MGVAEDLAYGKKLLPGFAGFLQVLYAEGVSRKSFAQYRDHFVAWRDYHSSGFPV